MFSLLGETASLAIVPQQRVCLISVELEHDATSGPAKETTIQGRLILTLKKPTKLKEVYVKVVAKANVRIGEHYASATILERRVATGWHETVQEGKWEFPFDIPIPSTSPASVASVHGRIAWQIVAVAAGLGRFGADLEAHQSIELIHAPSAPGNTPPSLEFDVEAPVHEIGRFRSSYVAIWANIGVLGIAWLSFAGPPVDAEVLDYEAKIVEHCSVKNVEEPFQTVEMPAVHAKIFSLKGVPLFKLKAEQPFEHGPTWARLPTHSVIHPSTDPLADSPIRFSHEIFVSFSYKTPLSDEPRTVVQSAKCHLYSCVYFEKLPNYSGVVSDQYNHTGMCECEINMERQFAECEQTLLARSSQRRHTKSI